MSPRDALIAKRILTFRSAGLADSHHFIRSYDSPTDFAGTTHFELDQKVVGANIRHAIVDELSGLGGQQVAKADTDEKQKLEPNQFAFYWMKVRNQEPQFVLSVAEDLLNKVKERRKDNGISTDF